MVMVQVAEENTDHSILTGQFRFYFAINKIWGFKMTEDIHHSNTDYTAQINQYTYTYSTFLTVKCQNIQE